MDQYENMKKDMMIICRDFEMFCEYLLEEKVKLSKTSEYINKKACFEINSRMYRKETFERPTLVQKRYPIIHFFYYVALKYQILEINVQGTEMEKGRNYQLWMEASDVERYLIFFQYFWLEFQRDIDDIMCSMRMYGLMSWMQQQELRCGMSYKINSAAAGRLFDGNEDGILSYMEELALIRSVQKEKGSDGGVVSEIIEIKPLFEYFLMEKDRIFEGFIKNESLQAAGEDMLYRGIKRFASDQEITLDRLFIRPQRNDYREKSVELSVSVRHGKCTRVIRMNLSDSLFDLHEVIQKSVDFDDDHLFAFYVGKGILEKTYMPEDTITSERELGVEETCLGDLDLKKGKKFSYLFDFGDMWWFDIQVLQIYEERVIKPMIIKKQGKAPEQY